MQYRKKGKENNGDRPGRGGGGTLIFSYIRRLGLFFGVPKIEFPFLFNIFLGVIRKIIIFLGMMILWIFFWGHHKI